MGDVRTMEGIILASASPRRADLLGKAGVGFEVMVSPSEEPEEKPVGIPVELWPMCLAFMKASAVAGTLSGENGGRRGRTILAADTIVVDGIGRGERILNKARDGVHAREMLLSLSGREHRVITGICLMNAESGRQRLASATAVCHMIDVSEAQLAAYIESGAWKGKAGAYGIQDPELKRDPFITLKSGDVTTVMGLPMEVVLHELATF